MVLAIHVDLLGPFSVTRGEPRLEVFDSACFVTRKNANKDVNYERKDEEKAGKCSEGNEGRDGTLWCMSDGLEKTTGWMEK